MTPAEGHIAMIHRFLELLFEPGDVFEVRAPACRESRDARYTHTWSGYFTHETLAQAAEAIAALDDRGAAPGIYVTLNPVAPALLARSAHRLTPRARVTTQDRDIVRRRWLLVDVDPVRPAGVSATDVELAAAAERAADVAAHLTEAGWPAPVTVMSGNGYHLLYRIDLPADDGGLVRGVLTALAQRFDDGIAAVDRSVFNPARIVKIAGTTARKGDPLPGADQAGRPHRRAELIDAPDPPVVVPSELLAHLVPGHTQWQAGAESLPGLPGRIDGTPAGVRDWLAHHGVVVRGERRAEGKTLLLLERCPINPEIVSAGGSDIAVLVGDDGRLAYCNKHNRGQAYTWHDLRRALEPDYVPRPTEDGDVDLSGLLSACSVDAPTDAPAARDPGPTPDELLRVPGFISEVMDHCLATAPYPNPALAFCGALALQAFLAGRKVRDPGDVRTNLYLLALAMSSAGKDAPRKLNVKILHAVGLARCHGDQLASGEGIQDALFADPALLIQTDEIDTMLQAINRARDARYESMLATLLTLYSASNSIFPMRRKAGKEHPGAIDQPCLVLYGTAIPAHYYGALSERMLTNGFFARMLIVEAVQRGTGQESSIRDVPPRVLATARWWAEYQPRGGNLVGCHPEPTIVEQTPEAQAVLAETRATADAEYGQAEAAQDAVGTTVWGRVNEQARKLALLYALSENHTAPRVRTEAAQWATQLVMHQARRMLYMAESHVAENPFQAECLKLLKKLRESPQRALPHQQALRRMKIDAKRFRELIETLAQRGDITIETVATGGRSRLMYRLAGAAGVKEGEGR